MFIPIGHDYSKVSRFPFLTFFLILLNTLLFFLIEDPRVFGFIPANPTFISSITSMFMHADIFHLAGNMYCLYLMGPFVEDALGRIWFLILYFLSHIFAIFLLTIIDPDCNIAGIGASGAISGLMGIFLIYYSKARIHFFYWFFFIFWGTVSIPVWVVFPLNAVKEWLTAMSAGTNVFGTCSAMGNWVHFLSFVFGFIGALFLQLLNIGNIESEKSSPNEDLLTKIPLLESKGKRREAYRKLWIAFQRNPENDLFFRELHRVGRMINKEKEVFRLLTLSIEEKMKRGNFELVILYLSYICDYPEFVRIGLKNRLRIIEYIKTTLPENSSILLIHIISRVDLFTPKSLLKRIASLAEFLKISLPGKITEKLLKKSRIIK